MNRIFLFVIVFLFSGNINAQAVKDTGAEKENIKVVSRYRNSVVELRWYPTSAASWRKANKFGYSIKRMELSDAGSAAGFKELAVVKPYTAEEWKQKTDVRDSLVKTAMESLVPMTAEKGKSFVDVQNEENVMFFAYVLSTSFSAAAARGAGLVYNDNNIESGKRYVYKISINSNKGKEPGDEVLALVTDTRSEYIAPAPQELTFEEGEGTVKLIWNNTTNHELFTAYHIERSSDGGRTFITLNKVPFISVAENTDEFYYTDSVKNYIPYQYRIVGITPWTDKSSPSEIIMAMGRDKTPASPPMNVRAKGDRSKILVTWELPARSKDLKGFQIARGKKLEGPFNSISDKINLVGNSQRMFVDTRPSPAEPYYVVYAVDTANNFSSTFSVMASVYDTIGPARPIALAGRIDSNGVVNISWKFGNDNDLVGYSVYVANGKDNVYRQITGSPLVDSVFADTVSMRSLTKNVYYKITAVDYNNNASEYSELLTLKRPDVIPPVAPVIKSYSVNGNKVNMIFIASSSDDVVNYQLIRLDNTGKKLKLAETKTIRSFSDSAVTDGASYSYTLIAVDESGLSTSSKPLQVSVQEQEMKEGIKTITARVNDKDKQVLLSWVTTNQASPSALVLFRAVDGGEMTVYKKLSPDKQSYTDNTETGKYQYAIKVLYNNGAESELSDIALAEIKN